MQIEGLNKYRGHNPRGYFENLPWNVRQRAYGWLHYLMEKGRSERGSVPPWLFALYVGQSKRLALNPPSSAWGRSMRAKKGGYAVQRRYRMEGQIGPSHPAHKAACVSAMQRRWRKQEREETEQRRRLGLPPKPRVRHLPLF